MYVADNKIRVCGNGEEGAYIRSTASFATVTLGRGEKKKMDL